ncbi:MAG: hypothetical protein DI551_04895 [Micavibrio aeruginosavorus]|uniref:GGDEF domain-containing protein n=1 Tax=Micavibrio aeruginosavorus TaxID=349221 RepID=A0A2W5PP96_9BACT|nr:MAG: hypothetical protein DI551_04895 [Micavibrio aeruginosavorus]
MALEYKSQIGLDAIMPVLDEYVVWYGKLVKSYFEGTPHQGEAPVVFGDWLAKAKADQSIDELTAERLKRVHEGMVEAAKEFTSLYNSRENPPLKQYDELNRYYEEFIQLMRRLELDHATENSGFDEKTGLRSVKLMHDDVAREMERRARRGNPFSLALVKINGYKESWQQDAEQHKVLIRKLSDKVKECLRSFDDAYYLGNEFFVLALKHADVHGSQAAVGRLNSAINGAQIPYPDDSAVQVSVSTVVSEPTQGDDFDVLLANMKKDLEGIETKGTVVQYTDVSPLQRYIHSIGKDK